MGGPLTSSVGTLKKGGETGCSTENSNERKNAVLGRLDPVVQGPFTLKKQV